MSATAVRRREALFVPFGTDRSIQAFYGCQGKSLNWLTCPPLDDRNHRKQTIRSMQPCWTLSQNRKAVAARKQGALQSTFGPLIAEIFAVAMITHVTDAPRRKKMKNYSRMERLPTKGTMHPLCSKNLPPVRNCCSCMHRY